MSLPILTNPEDVQAMVDYLRTKAAAVTIEEAKAVVEKKTLDPRKINAYEAWGFILKEGNRVRLNSLGRDLSRAKSEAKTSVYAQVLHNMKPYESALEWTFHQNLDRVTSIEIAAYWNEHFKSDVGSSNERAMKEMAICFFHLCQAAGLGQLTLGRRGQSTRFEISREHLGQFVGESVLVSEDSFTADQTEEEGEEKHDAFEKEELKTAAQIKPVTLPSIFISHGKNMEIVDQIKTMLELADLAYEIAEEEETSAIPVPEKVFSAMRKCAAAVICVTADESERRSDGTYGVNQNVLIEIGAAFVLYDKKVILVWDKNVIVPSNLQGLYRCEFSGNELSWSTGMKLMKAVAKFKSFKTDI